MDEWSPLYWLIFLLTVLIAVLALRDPWSRELWDEEDDEVPEQEEPPRRA